MEKNHQLSLKNISRLFPSSFTSSCNFKNVGDDVAETSINPVNINAHSSSSSLSLHKPSSIKTDQLQQKRAAISLINHSSTSKSGCFTSSDGAETDTFFSLSSNSATASRRIFSRRHDDDDHMKSIHENHDRRSISSADAKCSRRATATAARGKKTNSRIFPASEVGSGDQISTEVYYSSGRRNRRRVKKKKGAVIGDSYAVEKRSSDPHGDFRASMVEMIVEKRIFAAEDLERLLHCFLSLNSPSYHGIIFHVFSQICQTLFTN